jgi:hypothetical protein
MTKAFISFLALAALATPAAAEDSIRVSLVGKTPAMIHEEISRAALKVCLAQPAGPPFVAYTLKSCREDAIRRAEATLAMNAETASASRIASAR